jgi:prepilin-type N-terminal cleavage/methylation domain-containing protein
MKSSRKKFRVASSEFRVRNRGFTLVEMLVAVALVLFILGLFSLLMQSAMQGVREAKGINAVDQRLRNAVTILKADLRQVYLANGGTRFSPAELFTRRDRVPTAGYFSIYENSRSLPQGVDQYGNPVSLDFDDVLAMTVARRGDSTSEMFYGRANPGYSTATVNGAVVDVGIYLDNFWKSPASRFDAPANQLVTSRFAEVIYFVRPQGETPTLADVVGDPWVFGNQGGMNSQTLPNLPKTFTLYRRQLLVLDDDSLNRPATNSRGVGPVVIPGGTPGISPYNAFDVSMTRELTVDGTGNLQLGVQGGNNVLHFNTLSDLTRREFRYGMQPVLIDLPQPFNNAPYINGPPQVYGYRRTLRAYPLSHVDSTAGGANAIPHLHDYYSYITPGSRAAPATTPAAPGGSLLESWVGMPTLSESAHPNYPFWLPGAVDNTTATVNLTMDTATGELTNYPAGTQRGGEDVLLRDVVSFNIQVLEDIGGYRGMSADGTGVLTNLDGLPNQVAIQASGAGGQIEYHDLTTGGALYNSPTFPAADPNVSTVTGRRANFVDLGYGADADNYTTPTGGNDGAPATVNVLTLSNYLFQATPAPIQPPNFTANGTAYSYSPGYATIPGGLAAAPFNHVWPPTTPVSLQLPGNNALMRGAFSPVSAPFGVPLDCRFWVSGDVNNASKQSDVYLGPDGKAGIAGLSDFTAGVFPQVGGSAAADDGPLDLPTATPPGEYGAPRSDDLLIDPAFDPAAVPVGANTAFVARPGITGADLASGERGRADDYYIPTGGVPDMRDKPYTQSGPPATPTQYSLGELFASGSDDNPFVGVPFRLSGQVAANAATIGAKYHPFNLYNFNPRNTYDSWSGSADIVNEYGTPTPVLPGYKASPVRLEQMFAYAPVTPAPPAQAVERSYIPEPDFRPAPYARPVKAVQVKIRVLERRTGIVRDATVRHFFTSSGTE